MGIAIISHPDCLLHDMGPGHPESPDRIRNIEKTLQNSEVKPFLHHYNANPANLEDLKRVQDSDYVDFIIKKSPKIGDFIIDPDTIMSQHTLRAALLAAGAVKQGIDLVMAKEEQERTKEQKEKEHTEKKVFCNVRPPGHHAEKTALWGFVSLIILQ